MGTVDIKQPVNMRSTGCIALVLFCLVVLITISDAKRPSFGKGKGKGKGKGGGKPSVIIIKPQPGKPGKPGKPSKPGRPCKGKGKPKPPYHKTTTTEAPTTLSGSCNCDVDAIKAAVLAEVAITISNLENELNSTRTELRSISEPDVFSCKRMSGFRNGTIPVPYTACDVEKPSGLVDINSGKFTVQRDGVYRLTFTSRMSAMNGQTIRADMYVNGVRIGRASASLDTFDTQTNTSSTTILDLETSNTLDLLYELKAGDEVYMMIDYVGTTSLIQSSMNYQIFFTGEWIRV